MNLGVVEVILYTNILFSFFKARTLFREQGITIASVITALGLAKQEVQSKKFQRVNI